MRVHVLRIQREKPPQLLHGLGEPAFVGKERGEVGHGLSVTGIGLHRIPVGLSGILTSSQRGKHHPQVIETTGVLRLGAQEVAERLFRAPLVAEPVLGNGEVVQRIRPPRLGPYRCLVFLARLPELPDPVVDDAEVVVQPGLVRVDLEPLLVDPDGVSEPALAFENRSEVDVRGDEGRVHGDGLGEVLLRLRIVSQRFVDIAEVVVHVPALRGEVDGTLEMGDGLPVGFDPLEEHAEVVVSLGVVRLQVHRFLE